MRAAALAFVGVLAFAAPVLAQTECLTYSYSHFVPDGVLTGSGFTSHAAMCSDFNGKVAPYFLSETPNYQPTQTDNCTWNRNGGTEFMDGVSQVGECPPPPPSCDVPAGNLVAGAQYVKTNTSSSAFCLDSCRVVAAVSFQEDGQGDWYARGPYTSLGVVCTVGEGDSPPGEPPEPLEPGNCPGEVNDVPVPGGVPCGRTSTTEATINPDGSRKEVTTTCQGGNCTTTEMNIDSEGGTSAGPITTGGGTGGGSEASGGSGSGDGDDGGDEPGECELNSSAAGCGGTPSEVGSLYTGSGKTLDTVLATFRAQAEATPLGSGVGDFFTITGGGSCPTYQWEIPYIEASVPLDVFCEDWVATALQLLSYALAIVASFMAFKVAIGD